MNKIYTPDNYQGTATLDGQTFFVDSAVSSTVPSAVPKLNSYVGRSYHNKRNISVLTCERGTYFGSLEQIRELLLNSGKLPADAKAPVATAKSSVSSVVVAAKPDLSTPRQRLEDLFSRRRRNLHN